MLEIQPSLPRVLLWRERVCWIVESWMISQGILCNIIGMCAQGLEVCVCVCQPIREIGAGNSPEIHIKRFLRGVVRKSGCSHEHPDFWKHSRVVFQDNQTFTMCPYYRVLNRGGSWYLGEGSIFLT